MQHVASCNALRKQTDEPIVADLQESIFAAAQMLVRLDGESLESFAKRSDPPKSSHAAVQTRENLKCAFCRHCCGASFIGG